MSDLKPCPFCGGEAVEGKVKFNGKESERDGWLGCRECRVFLNYTNGERGKKMAIEIWNTRYERTSRIVEGSRKYVFSDGTELFEDGCSECNGYLIDRDNYCPNCGAKVVE
jgi:Lar family restriction alleviation protein